MPPYPHRKGAPDLMDADISYPLERLFDPFNMDHIPERQRMSHYEHRDLAHVKHYKAAVKIFGGPLSRKRVINAPPMETPMKHRLGLYLNQKSSPPSVTLNSDLQPQIPPEKEPPEELVIARQAREREDTYKAWFKERQKFRSDLENMGLNMKWLDKKPDKTVLERRVLKQLKEEEGVKIAEEIEREKEKERTLSKTSSTISNLMDSSDPESVPKLQIPSPLGLKILEEHLQKNKLRLLDLFTRSDKAKNWQLSREDFYKTLQEYNIPISKGLLEDMLIALDFNMDEALDYKEMARGMERLRKARREDKRKQLSREATSLSNKSNSSRSGDEAQAEPVVRTDSQASRATAQSLKEAGRQSPEKSRENQASPSYSSKSTKISVSPDEGGRKSGSSKKSLATQEQRNVSPTHLQVPETDTQVDKMVLGSDEAMLDLRKRDREGLKGYKSKLQAAPGTILTGSKAIDDHCRRSTLEGEVGEMVDDFRQKKLQEFYEVVKLCESKNVALNRTLLERVLLYPPDHPHTSTRKIRHPDSAPLIVSTFADPPKRPRTPIEVKHKDKVRRSKSGKLLIDSRHKYPPRNSVDAQGFKKNLSTGRAVIRRHVDCWMTFEEYDRLTSHLAIRYQHLHNTRHYNAFWPGHLLDKMRLCMPPYDQPPVRDKEQAVYTRVQRTQPAVNYGYEAKSAWPISDLGYVQVGIHDPYARKHLV